MNVKDLNDLSRYMVLKYVVLSRVKLLKPTVDAFIKMCSDFGLDPTSLLSEISVEGERVELTWDGEKYLEVMARLMRG